ncbi:MAG: AMP-binding protein [Flavobacteriales bacterium Tduv]
MWLDFSEGRPNLDRLEKEFSEDWQLPILNFLRRWYDDQPTVSVHSSGTTGVSRSFSVKKEHMVYSARMTGRFFNLGSGRRSLLCFSSDYIAAKMLLVRASVLRWHLYCVPPSSRPLEGINETFDFIPMVPLQVANSLSDSLRVKIFLIGGASISETLERALQDCSSTCYASYGMTETLGHVALRRINAAEKDRYFQAFPGVRLSIDEHDCLKIFDSQLMDEPLQTRDLVELLPSGRFIWLGRQDHLINSGGVKIIPEKWEEQLRPFIYQPFFIAGLPDEVLGQKVALFVQGKPYSLEIPEVLFVGKNRFCKPREVCFISYFSWTSSGKIRRKETLQRFIEGQIS